MDLQGLWNYRAFGFSIVADFEIPEFLKSSKAHDGPDIMILLGRTPDNLNNPIRKGPRFQVRPNELLLKLENVARFLVTGGTRIVIEPCPGAEARDIRLFLLGSVFGACLYQRGALPLHASSLDVGKGCVLLCGASGAGKSTTACSLVQRGYKLHSDDIGAVDLSDNGNLQVRPAYPQIKLWNDAFVLTGLDCDRSHKIRRKIDKYALAVRESFSPDPLPLTKIFIISLNNGEKPSFRSLHGIIKFNLLTAHMYRRRFRFGMEDQKIHFKIIKLITDTVPVVQIMRPPRIDTLNHLTDRLEDEIGK